MASSSSQWHAINPHTRPLSLSILELTPLALTLSLTLAPPPSPSLNPVHTSHSHQHIAHVHNHAHGPAKHRKKARHRRPESDDEATAVEVDEDGQPITHTSATYLSNTYGSSNFKDLLSHGVVVSVNGQPWNRIVAHVSEPEDEGVEADTEDHEEGDAEWEDDSNKSGDEEVGSGVGLNEQASSSGMTKRRPRKARFVVSAEKALHGEEDGSARRRKPSPGSEKKDKLRSSRDQAVVVVYGLSPGIEYEIELQVLGLAGPDGDALVSNSVMVPASPMPGGRSRANSFLARSRPGSRSNSVSGPHPGRPLPESLLIAGGHDGAQTNGQTDIPPAPIATNILNPVDTQAAQIRHMIAAAHAEKDHLQTQIKDARRTSQRAEAALRAEIETVKRAIDKAGSMDLRAKQKALALQEQVKQGWAGAENAESQCDTVHGGLSNLESRLKGAIAKLENFEKEYKVLKGNEEAARQEDRKMRVGEEKKLAEVVGKIEKLRLKKDKKEAEKAELESKLMALERQREEAEKKTEEEKYARRSNAYWWDPQVASHGHGHSHNHGHGHGHHGHNHDHHGPHRGRGGFQSRTASGRAHQAQAMPSPTHSGPFFSSQQSIPASTSSPAGGLRPPKPASVASPSVTGRTPSASGVNVSATPFHPSSPYPGDAAQHTALMPPQLQHRIYPPSERPRPAPTFNPPPSVLAEQARRQSPTIASSPTFASMSGNPSPRPTDTEHTMPPAPGGVSSSTPSLASIVTRAVLSPTSALANQNVTPPHASTSLHMRPSPPPGTSRSSTFGSSLASPSSPSMSPSPRLGSHHSSGTSTRHPTFGPPPSADRSDRDYSQQHSPLSPSGPWSAWHNTPRPGTTSPSGLGSRQASGSASGSGSGGPTTRTGTPPGSGNYRVQRTDSPLSAGSSDGRGGQSGASSRQPTS